MLADYHRLIITMLCCIGITSCKLDPVIYPGQKGYVAALPPGTTATGGTGTTTGGTGTTKPGTLAGKWSETGVQVGLYDANYSQIGSTVPSITAVYNYITIDDVAKKLTETDFTATSDPIPYVYDSSGTLAFITLSNPLINFTNPKIYIKSLTATSMVWIVINTDPTDVKATKKTYTGFEFDFSR